MKKVVKQNQFKYFLNQVSGCLVNSDPTSLIKEHNSKYFNDTNLLNRHGLHHGWEWQMNPKYRYTKTSSRQDSEYALTR